MYLCIGERNCYQCYLKKDCALLKESNTILTNSLNNTDLKGIRKDYRKWPVKIVNTIA